MNSVERAATGADAADRQRAGGGPSGEASGADLPWGAAEGVALREPPICGSAESTDGLCWKAIYASHFLRTWAERAWEFAVGLILLDIVPDTLWLVGTYGLLENMVVVVLVPYIGAWLDRTPSHLRGALVMFQWQNTCNFFSASMAFVATSSWPFSAGPRSKIALVVGMVVASCMAKLASAGASLSVERKWVKVLCASDSPQRMAVVNSAMRRVDLICLLAAPILTGALMTLLGTGYATLALATWSLASWLPQVLLLRYAAGASLHGDALKHSVSGAHMQTQQHSGSAENVRDGPTLPRGAGSAASHLKLYAQQPIALAGLSLAMLYFSVLSLGIIMTSWLKWRGISELELGAFRGIGAGFSVLSTMTFPPLNKKAGSEMSGLVGSIVQLGCLGAVTTLLFLTQTGGSDSGPVVRVMLSFLMLSRWGLWTFDLAVTQQMQEQVEGHLLGVVNGVQGSLQSAFELGIAVLTILISQPRRFPWLAVASMAQVALALAVYIFYVIRARRSRTLPAAAGYLPIPEAAQ